MSEDINLTVELDKKNDVNVDIYASAFSEETAAVLKKMQAQLDELTKLVAKNTTDIEHLENDEHDLGEQVSHLQSDFNLLKTTVVTVDGSQTLSNKVLKGELRLVGDNAGETFNVSFAAGRATLATNNGLDILSHTQFLEEPTVEIVKDYNKLTGSNLITKQHLETKG